MPSVMIVDDAVDTCEPLAKYLERCGFDVVVLPNGRDALKAVLHNPPDVVVLDLLMPEMDGPTFLEVVRSYLRLQGLPVVVLSALSHGPMVERARRLKVNNVLVKTRASLEEIKAAVEDAIERANA